MRMLKRSANRLPIRVWSRGWEGHIMTDQGDVGKVHMQLEKQHRTYLFQVKMASSSFHKFCHLFTILFNSDTVLCSQEQVCHCLTLTDTQTHINNSYISCSLLRVLAGYILKWRHDSIVSSFELFSWLHTQMKAWQYSKFFWAVQPHSKIHSKEDCKHDSSPTPSAANGSYYPVLVTNTQRY